MITRVANAIVRRWCVGSGTSRLHVCGARREVLAPVAGGCFKEHGNTLRIVKIDAKTTFLSIDILTIYERFGVSVGRGATNMCR